MFGLRREVKIIKKEFRVKLVVQLRFPLKKNKQNKIFTIAFK
jgi:hypothetical protein